MKLFLFVALLAFAGAVQVSPRQDQLQLHQCTCEDQYKGIREWKDFATQCSDQCRLKQSTELQSMVDTPVKLYSCIDQKIAMIHRLFDCLNSKLIKEDSCVSDTVIQTGREKLSSSPNTDFRQLVVGAIQPLVDEVYNTLTRIDQNVMQKYGLVLLDHCSRNCLFNKIKQSQFWDQINCLPKVDENVIQKHLKMCYHEVDYKDTIHKVCKCSVDVGVDELQPFCQKLRTTRFPQWAEDKSSWSKRGYGSELNEDQISGHYWPRPHSQKLLVKLAVEQKQPYAQKSLWQDESQEYEELDESIGGYKRKGGYQGSSTGYKGTQQYQSDPTENLGGFQ